MKLTALAIGLSLALVEKTCALKMSQERVITQDLNLSLQRHKETPEVQLIHQKHKETPEVQLIHQKAF